MLAGNDMKRIRQGIAGANASRTHSFEGSVLVHCRTTRPTGQGDTFAKRKGAGAVSAVPLSIVKGADNRYEGRTSILMPMVLRLEPRSGW